MDIQNLREAFTPATWEALREYFREELIQKLSSPSEPRISFPAKRLLPLKRKLTGEGRSVEFPPPLDVLLLAYKPSEIDKLSRHTDAVAYRRDFIAEAVRKSGRNGVSEEDILDHLVQAKFPVDSDYYRTEMPNKGLRIWSAIQNDLSLFRKNGWVEKGSDRRWRWVRSGPAKKARKGNSP